MSAIRVARGYTERPKIIKFEGGWHGHGDSFLIKAGSSALTLGAPDSPGIPQGVASDTITLPYNDAAAVEQAIEQNPGEIVEKNPNIDSSIKKNILYKNALDWLSLDKDTI